MTNDTCQNFPNYGYLLTDLTDKQLAPINAEIDNLKKDFLNGYPMNMHLAGNLRKEFALKNVHDYIEALLYPYLFQYNQQFNFTKQLKSIIPIPGQELRLHQTWVNFQEKHEFNPMHDHTGIFSFVIWIQVPFTRDAELSFKPEIPHNQNHAGMFQLVYNNSLGQPSTLNFPVDKTWENKLLIFPAGMAHMVTPFYTSDDYRISVSGNFAYIQS